VWLRHHDNKNPSKIWTLPATFTAEPMTVPNTPPAPPDDTPQAIRTDAPRVPRVRVETLLAGGREAILEHGGQDYRLRITANGKLILTK
jgi:hemin uptake protein HemP